MYEFHFPTLKIAQFTFSLFLMACNPSHSDNQPKFTSPKSGAFKVAIILPGTINDGSWNQSGYEGLKLIQKQLGAEIAYTSKVSEADAEKIIRQYAQQNFDFIIIHGGQYLQAAETIAQEFPRHKFAITTSYGGNNKNLGALAFRTNEVGYLAGVIAAFKTKTNKISFIGGKPQLTTKEGAILVERAAKKINPNIKVSINWVHSWQDPNKAKSIAQTQIKSGSDVLISDADLGNFGVLHAAKNNKSVSVITWMYAIDGVQKQYELVGNTIITGIIQQVPQLLLEGATLAQQGRWEGKQYKFGMLEEVQDLSILNQSLTPQQINSIKSIKTDIISGKVNILP